MSLDFGNYDGYKVMADSVNKAIQRQQEKWKFKTQLAHDERWKTKADTLGHRKADILEDYYHTKLVDGKDPNTLLLDSKLSEEKKTIIEQDNIKRIDNRLADYKNELFNRIDQMDANDPQLGMYINNISKGMSRDAHIKFMEGIGMKPTDYSWTNWHGFKEEVLRALNQKNTKFISDPNDSTAVVNNKEYVDAVKNFQIDTAGISKRQHDKQTTAEILMNVPPEGEDSAEHKLSWLKGKDEDTGSFMDHFTGYRGYTNVGGDDYPIYVKGTGSVGRMSGKNKEEMNIMVEAIKKFKDKEINGYETKDGLKKTPWGKRSDDFFIDKKKNPATGNMEWQLTEDDPGHNDVYWITFDNITGRKRAKIKDFTWNDPVTGERKRSDLYLDVMDPGDGGFGD